MSQVPPPTLADIQAQIAAGNIPIDPVEFSQAVLLLLNAIRAAAGGGGGITQLTGDVTAGPGSGSQVATLATVNSNVGSFTNAGITVDAKGRITAAASGAATSPGGSSGQVQYNNAGAFGGVTGITLSAGQITGITYTAGQLTLTGQVSTGNATVRVTSGGRADFEINAVGDQGTFAFATGGTREWEVYNNGSLHFAKVGTGDICSFTPSGTVIASGRSLQLGNAAAAGAIVPDHSLIILDSTGTAYKIPCVAA